MKNYKIKKTIPNAMLEFYDVGFSEHDLDRCCLLLFKYVVCFFVGPDIVSAAPWNDLIWND